MQDGGNLKRIGITQRVSSNFHGQPHDCLDQSWADLLLEMDYVPVPLPNLAGTQDKIEDYLSMLSLNGMILSGGNDLSGQGDAVGSAISLRRDTFERAAIGWARSAALPLLGICRGMQLINVVFGGELQRIEGHSGTRHKIERTTRTGQGASAYLSDLPDQFEVNSFHNFAIDLDGLAPELVALFVDDAGHIEAFAHATENIVATMWHPERSAPFGAADMAMMDRLFSSKV